MQDAAEIHEYLQQEDVRAFVASQIHPLYGGSSDSPESQEAAQLARAAITDATRKMHKR